jgi:hypothetical protein
MSRIEDEHLKPTLSPFIRGELHLPITPQVARSFALFAFKVAVVLDQAHHRGSPFFAQKIRYAFRENQAMPEMSNMFVSGIYNHRPRVYIKASYIDAKLEFSYPVHLYVCTCAVGHIAFQVVTVKQIRKDTKLYPLPGFDDLAIPFWPVLQPNLVWPFPVNLLGSAELTKFADRWNKIAPEYIFRPSHF